MHTSVCMNGDVYKLPAFDMKTMPDMVAEYHISELLCDTTLDSTSPGSHGQLLRPISYSRSFLWGSSTFRQNCPRATTSLFQTVFKQGYGITKCCGCINSHPIQHCTYENANRVGSIVANTEAKIEDPETRASLWSARGDPRPWFTDCQGLSERRESHGRTLDSEAWLHTGHVRYIDREGFLTITGRIKKMVKAKGVAVAPAELKNHFLVIR
jgi:long-subunit acyl-CoA synthetase (AMP-forming)